MKKIISLPYQLYFFLTKYRIYLSIYFFLIAYNAAKQYNIVSEVLPVIIAFTMWHYSVYLFNKIYDSTEDRISQPSEALSDIQKKPLLIFSLFLLFSPIGILLFFHHSIIPYLFFIPWGILYSFPLPPNGFRIKQVFLLKNIYSAFFGWTTPIMVIIYFYSHQKVNALLLCAAFLFTFFVVMVYELIFDIRDRNGDKASNVITFPVKFGIMKTKFLCFFFLLLVIAANLYFGNIMAAIFSGYLFLAVLFINEKTPNWYYHFILLGHIVLVSLSWLL